MEPFRIIAKERENTLSATYWYSWYQDFGCKSHPQIIKNCNNCNSLLTAFSLEGPPLSLLFRNSWKSRTFFIFKNTVIQPSLPQITATIKEWIVPGLQSPTNCSSNGTQLLAFILPSSMCLLLPCSISCFKHWVMEVLGLKPTLA